MTKIITENMKSDLAIVFAESFKETANTISQNFKSELTSYISNNSITMSNTQIDDVASLVETEVTDVNLDRRYYIMASAVDKEGDVEDTDFEKREFLRRVIFGKRVNFSDTRHILPIKTWESGIVYHAYDDTQTNQDKNYYVTVLTDVVGVGSYRVYKCISNNSGKTSTIEPSGIGELAGNYEINLADGYTWKFMFEVTAAEYLLYQMGANIPYVEYSDVVNNAVSSISNIVVEKEGNGVFSEYILGDCIADSFTTSPLNANTHTFDIRSDVNVKSTEDAYTNMYVHFPSEGLLADIDSSTSTVDKIVTITFTTGVDASLLRGQTCNFVPKVNVSNTSGTRAIAYGDLNTNTGAIDSVVITERGTEYDYAKATISLPPALESRSSEISLRAIVSPRGGHGSNPITELGMSEVVVTTIFDPRLDDKIPISNQYTRIGVVKDPEFVHGGYPDSFDNRYVLVANGDVSSTITATGSYISQTSGTDVIRGRIHSITYHSANNETDIHVVDYIGEYGPSFGTGNTEVRQESTDDNFETIYINRTRVNEIEITPGNLGNANYVNFTGEVLSLIDFNPITRTTSSREKVNVAFDF